MAKYCLKKPSKRVACAKRYKIEKKVREHNKKLKKEAKRNARKKHRARNKPISVPNKCPFKEEILIEAEKQREMVKEIKIKQKEASKLKKKVGSLNVAEKRKLAAGNADLKTLLNRAAEMTLKHEAATTSDGDDERTVTGTEKSLKAYAQEVRKTIESADIVIEVLDARDPLGSRCKSVEENVLNSGKRLVLLLNKIDLVPKDIVQKWLDYLRRLFPTIAFKASTQEQSQKLGCWTSSNLNANSSKCIGADILMRLLGNYCRNKDIKTSIRVGIIGYPNVGKSSVINSLKRKKACNVGATPGITKQSQEIELDKTIRLIDSPGVVLPAKGEMDYVEFALKNALRIESLTDLMAPVQAILRRCPRDDLVLHYGIPEFNNCDEFLAYIARKIGRLKKGARPDVNAAAKKVLHDWNRGKLRYHTLPPEDPNIDDDCNLCTAELVDTFAKEFDLDALDKEQRAVVKGLRSKSAVHVQMEYNPYVPLNESPEETESMEVDAERHVFVPNAEKKKVRIDPVVTENIFPTTLENDGNVQLNKAIKLAAKKQKRKNKKLQKRTEQIAERMTVASITDKQDDYDFAMADV